MESRPLRIGFVPEHFSTPLHFALTKFSLNATIVPFPSGTGHMVTALQANQIDVGIGLTEGWVAGLGKAQAEGRNAGYSLVGTFVETPLCWAISTGAGRDDITGIEGLMGKKMGVSRIGSGSYVMGFVLADTHHWLSSTSSPFEVQPLQTFECLRNAVNDRTADFFMWEHFTSKRYFDNGSIKKIGEIHTPWPSWHVVACENLIGDERLEHFFTLLNEGVKYFEDHHEEAISYISSDLDYSDGDAREWLKTVQFSNEVKGVSANVIKKTIEVLEKSGVLQHEAIPEAMISIRKKTGGESV